MDAAAGLGRSGRRARRPALGDGTQQDLHLVATYDKSLGFADVLLPGQSVDGHLTDPPGVRWCWSVAATTRQPPPRSRTCGRTTRDVVIGGAAIIAAAEDANADTQAWVNYLLLGMVIAFAAFAVINTLMLAIRGTDAGSTHSSSSSALPGCRCAG